MQPADFAQVDNAIGHFVSEERLRSVAIEGLRGPALSRSVSADRLFPAASVAKLPLAAAIYERATVGDISLDERVARKELGRTNFPSILAVFYPDHLFTIRELCGLMLATSDNPIAQYLLDRVGYSSVNEQARLLGARTTNVSAGFEDRFLGERGRVNRTTPNDALRMLATLNREPRFQELILALKNNLRNSRIPSKLPDMVSVAHKTGSLEGVAIDVGIVYGREVDLGIAFFSDEQKDTAKTSLSIGKCVSRIWKALGET